MSGIYIHIPFCRKACHYCDFYFSTSLKNKAELVDALCAEIERQKEYLKDNELHTLYFGGGTPSLLSLADIQKIMRTVTQNYHLASDAEITLEANPDDLSPQKLTELQSTGVNRLSIGIQSFFDEDLVLMNRSHTAQQAVESVLNAQQAGFKNISIDLIYGLPNLNITRWNYNLQKAFDMGITHLSAYSLTLEAKTVLNHWVKQKKVILPPEAEVINQFWLLTEKTYENGFIHYEISNFCKEGMYAKHNSNYWKNEHYIGIGPSAHSYNGTARRWNISNNATYIQNIKGNKTWFKEELLTPKDKYNEYIMTRLRTIWGINTDYVKNTFGHTQLKELLTQSEKYLLSGHIQHSGEVIALTEKGNLLADKIASDFFIL